MGTGKGIFCTRKPPKTGKQENETTHHQRCHVKLLKEDMFTSKDMAAKSLIKSMDDKATVKPGTDIGVKGTRNQTILQPTDLSCARQLPLHDFSEPNCK